MPKFKLVLLIFLIVKVGFNLKSQTKLEEFFDKKQEKINRKIKEKTTDKWEKRRQEYDESNFNYAICFLDNSGLFEADEKGNGLSSMFLGAVTGGSNDGDITSEPAYRALKNGEMLLASNKYYLAEQSFLLAKKTYEINIDTTKSNVNYEQTLSNLGLMYQSRGMYSKAFPYNERALRFRSLTGKKSLILVSQNNMAVYKKETGNLLEAEKDLKQILATTLADSNALAIGLVNNNLAMVYLDMNKLKDAEAYMNKSLEYCFKELKENSGNFIKLRINLANVYRLQKRYEDAERVYLNAIEVKKKKLGTHPDLATLKKGLAQVYIEMNRVGEALELLKSASDINSKKLGELNPATLASKQELGNCYRLNNSASTAIEILKSVCNSKKDIYGETHPNYIQALEDLAIAQWQGQSYTEANANFKTVIDNTLNFITTFFKSLNDNEKTLYWEKTNKRLQNYYSYATFQSKEDTSQLINLCNTLINSKGFLLENSSKIRNAIANSSDVSLKKTYQNWQETNEALNRTYQLSIEEIKQEKINVDSLKEKVGLYEKELSQKSDLFKQSLTKEKVTIDAIQNNLKANECVVEILQLSDSPINKENRATYVAFKITKNNIKLITLGLVDSVNNYITITRDNLINQKPELNGYTNCWKNVDKHLAGYDKIYLSCDGAYHQLSVNSLKDTAGKYIVDKYTLQFIGNSKDILSVKRNEAVAKKPSSAFLVGNPTYGKSGMIEQLPGTEAEVKNINKQLSLLKVKTTTLIGTQATEVAIKKINSPSILHIATHGYFLADLSKMESNKVLGVDLAAAKDNPLLRSGVLLANCDNVFDENYRASANSENGILTSFEALSLNLDNTDLVVLSACETGLGSVKQGEGVYGLQRSFLIAGAKSIIMSLWSVSDEATMDLMINFYNNYAKTGNKQNSFNTAIKSVKTKYKDPYYWGAFVMLNK